MYWHKKKALNFKCFSLSQKCLRWRFFDPVCIPFHLNTALATVQILFDSLHSFGCYYDEMYTDTGSLQQTEFY